MEMSTVRSERRYRRLRWWKGVMGKSSGGKQVRAVLYGKMRLRLGGRVTEFEASEEMPLRKALERDVDELVRCNSVFEEDWAMVKIGEADGPAAEWWAGHLEELDETRVRRVEDWAAEGAAVPRSVAGQADAREGDERDAVGGGEGVEGGVGGGEGTPATGRAEGQAR